MHRKLWKIAKYTHSHTYTVHWHIIIYTNNWTHFYRFFSANFVSHISLLQFFFYFFFEFFPQLHTIYACIGGNRKCINKLKLREKKKWNKEKKKIVIQQPLQCKIIFNFVFMSNSRKCGTAHNKQAVLYVTTFLDTYVCRVYICKRCTVADKIAIMNELLTLFSQWTKKYILYLV